MAGSYSNVDMLNNTGAPAHDFEMEIWGISKSQLTRISPSNFDASVIRYGFGTATDFPGGVYVRWTAPYDAATGQFATARPVPATRSPATRRRLADSGPGQAGPASRLHWRCSAAQPSAPSFSIVAMLVSKIDSASGKAATARSMLVSRIRCSVG